MKWKKKVVKECVMEKEELDKIINEFEQELEDLSKRREKNSEKYSALSEEELVEQLTADYEMIYKDAVSSGMDIEPVSDEEDENE